MIEQHNFETMIRTIRRGITFFISLMLMITLLPALPAHAEESKTVRVGWYESPFNRFDEAGNRTGYAYEYQQRIVAYTGWEYEYVSGGWYELLQQLKAGELDIMTDVSKTPEREEEMLFSENAMGTEVYYIIVNSETSTINADDLTSLNGKKIGVAKDSIQEDQFKDWQIEHNTQADILELTGTDQENVEMLETGAIDGYLGVGGFEEYSEVAYPLIMTGSSDYYFAINKNRPDLKEEIDSAMNKILSANWYYSRELAEKYLSKAGASRFLTREEQDWLATQGAVRVGYLNGLLPFCEEDGDKGVTGLLSDFIKFAQTGLKNGAVDLEAIPFHSPQDLYQALEAGKIECAFPVSVSAAQAEKMEILLTDPITMTDALAVVRESDAASFDAEEAHTVAVVSGEYAETSIASNFFPGWEKIPYDSLEERLKAVETGKVDCVLMSNYQASVEKQLLERYHLTTVPTHRNPTVSFGVKKDYLPLYSILTKLSRIMPEAQVNTALSSYTRLNDEITITDFVRDHFWTVIGLLTAFLLVILVLLVRSRNSERETRKLNRTLLETERKVEAASNAKTEFLFNMSHDIRTPMNAIIGYTDMALRHEDEQKIVKDSLHKISAASEQLINLINDILDMSRIESGKLELNLEPSSIQAAEDNLFSMFTAEANDKEISLQIDTAGIIHDVVLCDRKLISRIIMNLLSNALKFTPDGGSVSMKAEELETDSDGAGATYRFTVADNGIGMSQEFLDKIYDPFERERTSTVSGKQGTGLGMSIVKKLVDLMQGTIEVESKPGQGTRFTVSLPLKFSDAAAVNTTEVINHFVDSFEGKTVLLVEDMMVNMELAKFILEEQKLKVDTAENGQIAVEMFQAQPQKYSAILMDIQMPVMNGYEATQAIRKLDIPEAGRIPIIAMTANAFTEDKLKSLSVGMNDHVAKPIDVQQLNRVLNTWIRP